MIKGTTGEKPVTGVGVVVVDIVFVVLYNYSNNV